MEISLVEHQGAVLFVGLVIICAVLVFAFGFKAPVELPNFKQLSSEEKKSVKKRKIKEKKSQLNGHATVHFEDSDSKKDHVKPLKQSNKSDSNKVKKSEEVSKKNAQKSPAKSEKADKKSDKENHESGKNKQSAQNITEDKPSDYDDGEWETAFSRKDKKNRKKEDDILTAITPENTPKSGDKKSSKQASKAQSADGDKAEKDKTSSPAVKKASDKKEANESKKKEKKSNSSPNVTEEKVPVIEPKPQHSVPQEKQDGASSGKLNSEESLNNKVKSGSESDAVSDEKGDQWEEAPQKKSKKKVRKE